MTESIDAIIVGAGHNGLVCGAYLARAGLKVVLLEARETSGGMSSARTFADDYHVPGLAHAAYPVPGAIREAPKSPFMVRLQATALLQRSPATKLAPWGFSVKPSGRGESCAAGVCCAAL